MISCHLKQAIESGALPPFPTSLCSLWKRSLVLVIAGRALLPALAKPVVGGCREELEARQQEAQAAEAQLRQLEEKHQEVKAQVDALAQQEEALKSRGEQLREAQKSDEQLAQVRWPFDHG